MAARVFILTGDVLVCEVALLQAMISALLRIVSRIVAIHERRDWTGSSMKMGLFDLKLSFFIITDYHRVHVTNIFWRLVSYRTRTCAPQTGRSNSNSKPNSQ